MDTFSNKKLEHKMGKNMSYDAGSKSNGSLDSSINTSKMKHFNSGMIKTQFLGLCDFGSAVDNVDMDLPPPVSLESSLCLVASVKEKLCFELTKSFTLDIGLLAISRTTLHNKLKSVRKLFYKIDGFGVHVAKANTNKQTWNFKNSYCALLYILPMDMTVHDLSNLVQSYDVREAAICSMLVFKDVNLVWTGLSSPKCVACDKRCFVLIYAKKQASVSHLIFFGSMTWASVVNDSSKNLSSTLFVGTNLNIRLVDSSMFAVTVLALHISVLKYLLENVFKQVANISRKLNRVLAVSLANLTVLFISEHIPVLNMAVNISLFIPFVHSVVTAISQNIFPSGFYVLTAKCDDPFLSPMSSLAWRIATCNVRNMNVPTKQNNIIRWHKIANKFFGVRVFTLGLDARFLGVGIALIMNENLAKHVSNIFEILDRLLMVHLLFKNKQFVSVLGLYVETFLDKCKIQAGLVNSFIVRACNESIFVILDGDFNENGKKCSSSFSKYMDLGLVNILVNSSYIKASTWRNFRGVKRTIDYIFVSQSLIVDVDEFFNTDHSFVQIIIGLDGILDPVLRAIYYKIASHDNFAMFSDKFVDSHHLVNLDSMWSVIHKAICLSVNEVFSKTWFKDFDSGFTKCSSYYHKLEILVSKLVKTSHSVLSDEFMIESKHAKNSQIRLAINRRIENFELNKSQIIRSVLEWPFCKITLNYLVVDEDLILKSGLVKFHHMVVDDISDEWSCQFQPLKYIFNDAFSNVMHPIEVDEFFDVVLDLPDNKAAGLSEAWVSMIPKPYDWKGVLTNIYPIALTETVYKILSKILSNRISLACSKYDVLYGDNFSVLKGTSTQSHIFAIGSVVENALEKDHKLWLVLQDMKKAYDLVGWEHLRRSLVRIKMCNRFIRFFGNIHNGCINRVMTDFGLTDGYGVHDGLDQGEVFLPLLWHIFYDTLLCEIKRQETVCGYRLNSHYVARTGHVNFQDGLTSFLTAGAFVATQHILNIVSEFFKMNNISINNDKTVTIPINCKVVAPFLSVSGTSIPSLKRGCLTNIWPSLAKAHSNVRFFANIVLRKAISDKQFSYLVLAVLYPIIGLPLDFFNDVLYHSLFYGLKTFKQVQTKDKIAAVVYFTNSVGILSQLFVHRLHNLQVLSWCLVHLLCFLVCININPLNNFLAGVVQVFFDSGLSLGNLICNAFRSQNGTFLFGILSKSIYVRCLPSLYHYKIAFKRLNLHGFVFVWFVTAIRHLYGSGSLDVSPFSLKFAAAKSILEFHEFRSVHDQLFSVGASGFFVYMDSSFCGLESVGMKAGAAVFFEDINLGLGMEVFGMVSSTLTKLQAIVLALECMPSLSSISLFSDSQVALDHQHIASIIHKRNLNVDWGKIKRHLGVLGNDRADLLTDKCFVLTNGNIVSGNSRHFVCDIFWSIYCTCWELGSGSKIVSSRLLVDIDWFKLSLVWHPDSHMAIGFISCHFAGSHSYFMKALHHKLPVTVRKCLYNRHYPNVVYLHCDNIKVSDHVFSCAFEAAAWTIFGLSHAFSRVLQMLSNCLANLELVASLCKGFVFVNWYQKAAFYFDNSKIASGKVVEFVHGLCLSFRKDVWLVHSKHHVFMEKCGLISCDGLIPVLVSSNISMLSARVIRLLGIDDAFGVSFGLRSSCWFFSGISNLVSVYVGV
ncbi:hypothetical protein G9A89_013754 [Geosiphon pyriformis]|nr:hypothetical protein G9A89_013754 [Geosiphon pyriformis]